jgi:hypothetical protein
MRTLLYNVMIDFYYSLWYNQNDMIDFNKDREGKTPNLLEKNAGLREQPEFVTPREALSADLEKRTAEAEPRESLENAEAAAALKAAEAKVAVPTAEAGTPTQQVDEQTRINRINALLKGNLDFFKEMDPADVAEFYEKFRTKN